MNLVFGIFFLFVEFFFFFFLFLKRCDSWFECFTTYSCWFKATGVEREGYPQSTFCDAFPRHTRLLVAGRVSRMRRISKQQCSFARWDFSGNFTDSRGNLKKKKKNTPTTKHCAAECWPGSSGWLCFNPCRAVRLESPLLRVRVNTINLQFWNSSLRFKVTATVETSFLVVIFSWEIIA